MTKEDIDNLYHLMRVASNGTQEEAEVFNGLAHHLFAGGDYLSLVQFSAFYGREFLIEPVCKALREVGWPFSRIVEFGAGLSWFGRGLASKLGFLPTLFLDKRPWTLIDTVVDLETENGRKLILEQMKPGDLIVASDLLHCLDDSKGIMSHFSKWPMAILEYCPTNKEYAESYTVQVCRYGANPIAPEAFKEMFPGRIIDAVDLNPYILILADKEE